MKNVKKWKYFAISILFMSAIFTISCTRDEVPPTQIEVAVQPEIADAMQWFEQQMYSKNYLLNKSGMQLYKDWMPDWGKATVNSLPNGNTVEIPIILANNSTLLSTKFLAEYERTKNPKYLQMDLRLVIETDIATGNKQDFIMLISPSLKHIDNYSSEANSYLNMDKNFDGMIYYYTPNWIFANGWGFTDGEMDRTITHYQNNTQTLTRGDDDNNLAECLLFWYGQEKSETAIDKYAYPRCYGNNGYPNDSSSGDSGGGGSSNSGNNEYPGDGRDPNENPYKPGPETAPIYHTTPVYQPPQEPTEDNPYDLPCPDPE